MKQNNIAILNYWWAANYGANLTAYALQQLIYNSVLIDNSDWLQRLQESKFKFHIDFSKKFLLTTPVYRKVSDFLKINNLAKTFIVGSDQVFRILYIQKKRYEYFLDFADANSKKIAFSASFGVDKEKVLKEADDKTIRQMKASLQSFDFVSVREKSGVEICRDLFNVNAEWIIDPVFILEIDKYIDLIKNSTIDYSGKIVSYIFEKNKKYPKAYKYIEKKYNTKVVETADSNISIENWLASIKNCKFLITDSFHGMCFAIIFNKPFICISNKQRCTARFESILEMLNIDYQCIDSIDEIYKKDCIFKIDYEKVNKRIKEERQRGLDFLKKALDAPAGKFKEKQEVRTMFLEEKICELELQGRLNIIFHKYLWNLWLIIFHKYLWNLWLIIFHKYLPEFLKNIIRKLRDLNANRRK